MNWLLIALGLVLAIAVVAEELTDEDALVWQHMYKHAHRFDEPVARTKRDLTDQTSDTMKSRTRRKAPNFKRPVREIRMINGEPDYGDLPLERFLTKRNAERDEDIKHFRSKREIFDAVSSIRRRRKGKGRSSYHRYSRDLEAVSDNDREKLPSLIRSRRHAQFNPVLTPGGPGNPSRPMYGSQPPFVGHTDQYFYSSHFDPFNNGATGTRLFKGDYLETYLPLSNEQLMNRKQFKEYINKHPKILESEFWKPFVKANIDPSDVYYAIVALAKLEDIEHRRPRPYPVPTVKLGSMPAVPTMPIIPMPVEMKMKRKWPQSPPPPSDSSIFPLGSPKYRIDNPNQHETPTYRLSDSITDDESSVKLIHEFNKILNNMKTIENNINSSDPMNQEKEILLKTEWNSFKKMLQDVYDKFVKLEKSATFTNGTLEKKESRKITIHHDSVPVTLTNDTLKKNQNPKITFLHDSAPPIQIKSISQDKSVPISYDNSLSDAIKGDKPQDDQPPPIISDTQHFDTSE